VIDRDPIFAIHRDSRAQNDPKTSCAVTFEPLRWSKVMKRFEVYRRERGRSGISRTLHHDPRSGRSWITEVHVKVDRHGAVQKTERVMDLDQMDPEDQALYALRLRKELDRERAEMPAV
jgi:hypothetical protein